MATSRVNWPAIRVIRERSDMTVRDLVAALHDQGMTVHEDSIRNIELGHKPCSIKLANGIARALKIQKHVLYADVTEASDAA